MNAWLRTTGVLVLSFVLSGWVMAESQTLPASPKIDPHSQERQAAKYHKAIAETEKAIPGLSGPGGRKVAVTLYRKYIDALKMLADAATQPDHSLRIKQEKAGFLLQRETALECLRLGIECPYKEWNINERKFISDYQMLMMIRPLAVTDHDLALVDFIDKYTLYLHQLLSSGETMNVKSIITEPENKEMRQQLALAKEKINKYKVVLAKMKPDARIRLQLEGAQSAPH